ncbi:dihydroorotase [Treponema sp.]|uniref:dihydroorotase n=1 Tax=Treponema sp. TaxID=166 RepID=UPI003F0B954D
MRNAVVIFNARLVDATMDKKNAAIFLENGKIKEFPDKSALKEILKDDSVLKLDAKGCCVLPSFIDMHSHFRDPGFTQKEDIESGSSAAAAGGFSTCVLMPNTNPVVSSQELAEFNNSKAEKLGLCKVFQSVSITENFDGKTTSHLDRLERAKVPVISEDGKEVCDSSVMLGAMKIAAKKKIVVCCHCEDPFLAESARPFRKAALEILAENGGGSKEKKEAVEKLKAADSILACAEDAATFRNLRLAKDAGCHIHLCHVSTSASVEAAKKARQEGVDVTFEITPHHIFMSGGKAPEIFNIVNPPLRSESDRLALIQALKNGDADCIATDHAPHTLQDKKNGSPGFSGLETAFSACYTMLSRKFGISLKRLSQLMSANPAKILGLKKEGLLKEGYAANIVVVNLDKCWIVRGASFMSRGKYTPLEGKKLFGAVEATFFNGRLVFHAPDFSSL